MFLFFRKFQPQNVLILFLQNFCFKSHLWLFQTLISLLRWFYVLKIEHVTCLNTLFSLKSWGKPCWCQKRQIFGNQKSFYIETPLSINEISSFLPSFPASDCSSFVLIFLEVSASLFL